MPIDIARRFALALAGAALLTGCAATGTSSVTGTATYRERMALPPEAVFEASIEDVSRADAPSVVIGSTRVESPRVPVEFAIRYDTARIDPSRRYVVRARVVLNGQPVFITDISHAVLTAGAGNRVVIVMRRAAGGGQATLENTYWKLVTLRGQPVQVAERQREPHVILQPAEKRVAGSGGCNRLAGVYTLEGERLSFARSIATMMACPQGMEQERAFLDTLAAVARWRVDGQRLDLLDERGAALAQFESRVMR